MNGSSTDNESGDDVSRTKRQKLDHTSDETEFTIARSREIKVEDLPMQIEKMRMEVSDHQGRLRSALEIMSKPGGSEAPESDKVKLLSWSPCTEIKVAMVGRPEAGMLINALLDSNDILPRHMPDNVAVEIHYNSIAGSGIEAVFDCITEKEWRDVIIQGKQEFKEHGKMGIDSARKLKAVYHMLSEQGIATTDMAELLNLNSGKALLGTKVTMREDGNLGPFVKNFDKAVQTLNKSRFKTWPLIESIHVRVHHPLLDQGLVLSIAPGIDWANGIVSISGQCYLSKCSVVCSLVDIPEHRNFNCHLQTTLLHLPWNRNLESVIVVGVQSERLGTIHHLEQLESSEVQELYIVKDDLSLRQNRLPDEIRMLRNELKEQEDTVACSTQDIARWRKARSKADSELTNFVAPRTRLDNGQLSPDRDGRKALLLAIQVGQLTVSACLRIISFVARSGEVVYAALGPCWLSVR